MGRRPVHATLGVLDKCPRPAADAVARACGSAAVKLSARAGRRKLVLGLVDRSLLTNHRIRLNPHRTATSIPVMSWRSIARTAPLPATASSLGHRHMHRTAPLASAARAAQAASSRASALAAPPLLLTPQQLHPRLADAHEPKQRVVLLDASWHMPASGRNPRKEYIEGPRLPRAQFWDVDAVATPATVGGVSLPHMLPSQRTFDHARQALGILPSDHVVAYDVEGTFSAPRTAFTFIARGHERVSILDGGLLAWVREGYPLEQGAPQPLPPTLDQADQATKAGGLEPVHAATVTYDDVVGLARSLSTGKPGGVPILDARSRARFSGEAPEPRKGMSSGHIPGSASLPFSDLVASHTFRSSQLVPGPQGQQPAASDGTREYTYSTLGDQPQLWRAASAALGGADGLEAARHASSSGSPGAVATCGSGMTAAIIWLALQRLGVNAVIYDEVKLRTVRIGVYLANVCYNRAGWDGPAGLKAPSTRMRPPMPIEIGANCQYHVVHCINHAICRSTS